MKTIRDLNQLPPKEKYRPGRVVIGVDPGVSGGVAVHYAGGEIYTFNMPKEVDEFRDLAERITYPDSSNVVYLEDVPAYAGKQLPGARMFKLGEACGIIRGIFSGLYIKTVLVRPQEWQKQLGLERPKGANQQEWKRILKACAQTMFPDVEATLNTADALLIMGYGLTQQN